MPSPRLWASWKPFGIGETRPSNYLEVARTVWENRRRPRYAWRILSRGTCDGCALGTKGLRDWTIDGVHLCNVRLRLLRLNTMEAFDPALLADIESLSGKSSQDLRELGRLPRPLVRRRGEPGFSPIGWDDALDLAAARIAATTPARIAGFLTSRGMPNESYYAAQKAMRALGTNSIDNAARVCHSPSTAGLKGALGVAATTCSYTDWIGSDLIVFIGSNPANNQPVAMKYLHLARKQGTQVVCVNPYREPGMERYWIPSTPESALFGTKITDRFYEIDTGGDIAFLTGVLKHLVEQGWVERDFVAGHTSGYAELERHVSGLDWETLEAGAGIPRDEMLDLARRLGEARTGVLVWSMGVTQHATGEDNVRAIVNLALARGWVGRPKCGLMPIRGHSGVQGGAEMGCYATSFPGGAPVDGRNAAELSERWGFEVPGERGLTAPEMVDAAAAGELDVLVSAGGNFLEVLPEPPWVEAALAQIPLRLHMDIVLSPQMLVEPVDTVLLLPATTRYEIPGGVTETSTERRIIFSPEVPGPRIEEARAEWWVFGELAARARPERADDVRFDGTEAIREEIARVVPMYAGIERLKEQGDQVQYGGPLLCEGFEFPTEDGRAHFAVVSPHVHERPAGMLKLSTRRGKQFNSMVYGQTDKLTGAERKAVLIAEPDAHERGLADGDDVLVRSEHGELRGHAKVAPVKRGNAIVHWPEGNLLIGRDCRSPESGIPDYTAWVEVLAPD
jgi:molybdopterin-dependent oxidoreductase alpha subunit